jgi:hypothetical protein
MLGYWWTRWRQCLGKTKHEAPDACFCNQGEARLAAQLLTSERLEDPFNLSSQRLIEMRCSALFEGNSDISFASWRSWMR